MELELKTIAIKIAYKITNMEIWILDYQIKNLKNKPIDKIYKDLGKLSKWQGNIAYIIHINYLYE